MNLKHVFAVHFISLERKVEFVFRKCVYLRIKISGTLIRKGYLNRQFNKVTNVAFATSRFRHDCSQYTAFSILCRHINHS